MAQLRERPLCLGRARARGGIDRLCFDEIRNAAAATEKHSIGLEAKPAALESLRKPMPRNAMELNCEEGKKTAQERKWLAGKSCDGQKLRMEVLRIGIDVHVQSNGSAVRSADVRRKGLVRHSSGKAMK